MTKNMCVLDKRLTPKQEAFCVVYMTTGGDRSAAYRASYRAQGMSDAAVRVEASRLAANPNVALRIQTLREAASKAAVIDEAMVVREAARIALSDIGALFDNGGNLLDVRSIPREARAAIASIEVEIREGRGEDREVYTTKKVKLWDKNSALEKLFKHLGLYERNNKQRIGLFDKLPYADLKMIEERIGEIQRRRAGMTASVDGGNAIARQG